jgi:hypothetical protein
MSRSRFRFLIAAVLLLAALQLARPLPAAARDGRALAAVEPALLARIWHWIEGRVEGLWPAAFGVAAQGDQVGTTGTPPTDGSTATGTTTSGSDRGSALDPNG